VRGCASPCGAVVGASFVVVVLGGDVLRFLVSSSSSSFPCGFCTCTSSPFPHTVGFAILWGRFPVCWGGEASILPFLGCLPRCCLLSFSLWGCVHLPAFARHPPPPRVACMCVPPELFICGSGTCLFCIGGRVSLFRRLGCVCAALCSCVFRCCNFGVRVGGGGVRVSMRWGVVSVLCVGGCASPCAGLVLFVGVLVGFAVSFLSWWGVHLPQLTPSHSIGFARVRGRFPVCSAVCVLFARWGG